MELLKNDIEKLKHLAEHASSKSKKREYIIVLETLLALQDEIENTKAEYSPSNISQYFIDKSHLNYQKQLVTPLFFDIKKDGIYLDDKLDIKSIEFGHYRTYPYELPNPRLIVDFSKNKIRGYIEKELSEEDKNLIINLLEKYHVYMWIFDEYHLKSNTRDPDDLEGYDWYLEIVFEGNIIWHIFGYNEYPDTYVHLAREILKITNMDLLEINTISSNDLKLFEKFGSEKLLD